MFDVNVPVVCVAITLVLTLVCSVQFAHGIRYVVFSESGKFGRKRGAIVIVGTLLGLVVYFAIGLPVAMQQGGIYPYLFSVAFVLMIGYLGVMVIAKASHS